MEALEEIGLTKNEAKAYVALLELGPCVATKIVEKTGLHRTVVYDVLERLANKGLISHIKSDNSKLFQATPPQKLKEILKSKEEKLDAILPQLLDLQSSSRLDVQVFKGEEGIKTVYDELLQENPLELLGLGPARHMHSAMPMYSDRFDQERKEKKIHFRVLYRGDELGKSRATTVNAQPFTQARCLPEHIKTASVINIYNNKVIFYSKVKGDIPSVIVITSEELALTFKEYFEYLWQLSTV